jgi:hypothetical protein
MDIHLVYRAEVFKEDGQFVAICPELNVSSFGDSFRVSRLHYSQVSSIKKLEAWCLIYTINNDRSRRN